MSCCRSALLALFALGATALHETGAHGRRASHAALQVTVLAEAARAHVESRYEAFRTAAGTGVVALPLATLRDASALPDDFPDRDALGHDLVVRLRAVGADGLELYVGERVRAGAATPPATALFQGRGLVRLGLLAPEAPGRLIGPGLDAEVSAFAAGDGDLLLPGAIAALLPPRPRERAWALAAPRCRPRRRRGQPHGDRPRHGRP